MGRVSRAPRELSAARNCTRDEGGPFEFGDQEPISSHRKLLRAKAVVVRSPLSTVSAEILSRRFHNERTAAEVSKAD
jgi:hypothetical protein